VRIAETRVAMSILCVYIERDLPPVDVIAFQTCYSTKLLFSVTSSRFFFPAEGVYLLQQEGCQCVCACVQLLRIGRVFEKLGAISHSHKT
jgi:hypothetical protein